MPLPFDPIAEASENWKRQGWGSVDAMAAATSITRAHQILVARINSALGPVGLNFSRFEALALLYLSRKGELPLGKVGERLQVHPASVTNTIDRLQSDGMVERVPHPSDGRTTLARITPAGSRLVDVATELLAGIDFGLAGMSGADYRNVAQALHSLRENEGDF